MADSKTIIDWDLENYALGEVQQNDLNYLLQLCDKHLKSYDKSLISRAFKLTYQSHSKDTRASGEPYYLHPLAVACIIVEEIGLDDVSVAAALLHDTVEDTDVTLDDIRKHFGDVVAKLIDGLTKIAGFFKTKGAKQAETFMKLLVYMADDLRVVLIKFADRLHNMRTLHHLPKAKQIRIATETSELYAPFAHRFGLYKIKSELEDLCLKATDEHAFKFIARKLKEKKDMRESFIREFMEPIREQLERSGFNFEIKGRPKHIYSIHKKMVRQQKPFEEIYDLFAIRIILDLPHKKEDCWRVYSFITDEYTPIPERFRDFMSVPKANGYQSLHTTVITKRGRKVEVQIRTRKMDEIAEQGLAAHWKYKQGSQGGEGLDKFVNWVREVLENPGAESAQEFVKDFQLNLYSREIYVFTPKGELRTLPQGATPIDFAFDIHSQIGERAISAKVNGRLVPLRHKLSSGDQVEVVTGKVSNLNPDWIDHVVTHKAKARLRQFLKQEQRKISDLGQEAWEKKADRNNFKISDQDLARIARKLGFPSIQAMFFAIGNESYEINRLVKAVRSFLSKGRMEEEAQPAGLNQGRKVESTEVIEDMQMANAHTLTLDGELGNIKHVYANCCKPIPGDEALGYVSREGLLKIHRSKCRNLQHLMKASENTVQEIKWNMNSGGRFNGAIKVIGEDRQGLVNDISDLLSNKLKTNMKGIHVDSDDGTFEGTIVVYVEDIDHLRNVITNIRKVEGVKSAYRLE
ncbi:GTP pyrophosphokinase/guanosine-3',5'-bis(diphosphate) 3'-pyrophosphohydrolase [Cyclonatronum proteinivorum]|uniref:GTP pyrophosphokinase/guanosine-3',5'-bis(Diphosphate) 3'-pyrophosphohydrolase n=1 Tax=Cyclonatronum proteinivorum TaxID=1457365 RepID=A0A345UMY4_9BACT|nr:bifunctional (p)ppGpp synthetase/guanosine-3',5'-bis(diphosphate) 3'-pyrophosphohydrolase [Cyclonatronum proteinivorum]AXJ01836.1 GTP pyrophosphokinase/guanosine-3',5'-bis(diphosphate) 3'-pyrophosphohydrolase [Cyclonatronum proteinivorum]